jgi:tRNA (cmo5U34)-methyltransferase
MNAFSDETLVSAYVKNAERMVPGLHDLPKMAVALLAERVPVDAHILVLGAGGGLELKVFAEAQAGWTFNGVDPSAEMLALARRTLGHLASTVNWHEGYIDTASTALCDGATCLLTLHFLTRCERLETLKQIHRRLKRGAPLIVVHHSIPNAAPDQDKWLQRNAAFAIASGMPSAQAGNILALKDRLPMLSPEQDVDLLREAGFADIELFYCAFTFKGWVAYAA